MSPGQIALMRTPVPASSLAAVWTKLMTPALLNLALGDARASQAKEYLAGMGVPGDQLRIVSFGKDRPICTDHDEDCWQKNRRAHITQAQAQ